MATQPSAIVQRLWNYCNVLRDDGVSYSDYVEQLTYLLFLKMAENSVSNLKNDEVVTVENSWRALLQLKGDELENCYRHILSELGNGKRLARIISAKLKIKFKTQLNYIV